MLAINISGKRCDRVVALSQAGNDLAWEAVNRESAGGRSWIEELRQMKVYKCIRVTVLVGCSVFAFAVFIFGFAGLGRLWADVIRFHVRVGERNSVHVYTVNGSLGFSLIQGDLVVIAAIDDGRAEIPVFADKPGFLLFGCSIDKTEDWCYWKEKVPLVDANSLLEVPLITAKVSRSDLYVPVWLVVLVFGGYPVHLWIITPIRR